MAREDGIWDTLVTVIWAYIADITTFVAGETLPMTNEPSASQNDYFTAIISTFGLIAGNSG